LNPSGKPPDPSALETFEIPTLLFGARTHLPYAVALIITLKDNSAPACRDWLKAISTEITFGHDRTDRACVLPFTANGLQKLGLPKDDLASFPVAFQTGMTPPGRARVLGDIGANAPNCWRWGYGDKACDVILIFYSERNYAFMTRLVGKHLQKLAPAGELTVDPVILQKRQRHHPPAPGAGGGQGSLRFGKMLDLGLTTEPFGFADGVSQPFIRGTPRAAGVPPRDLSPAGAFILGYEALDDKYRAISPLLPRDHDPASILPTVTGEDNITRADLGRNGSFLVVRQLEQDVEEFHAFAKDNVAALRDAMRDVPDSLKAKWVEAKLVGRWQNGVSLVRHPSHPGRTPDNDFLFRAEDPLGRFCPLGAHIRRANPRDSLTSDPAVSQDIAGRHRLLRVGRPYAPKKHQQPGILFMCLNADIELQFETVQQSWLNRTDFHGLRNESDPITGCDAAPRAYTIPTNLGPARLTGLQNFVKVVGGAYVFLPSRAAIRYLAGLKRPGSALEPLTVT